MKKLISVFVAIAIAAGAYAQIDSTSRKMSPRDMDDKNRKEHYNPADKSLPDGVLMQNGIVMKVEDGRMTILDDDMTMSNGTKIMSDGTWTKSDGTEKMLEDGQHIDMSGNMTTMKEFKDKDMDYDENKQYNRDDKLHSDGVMMQNGKLMKMQNGQMTTLDDDMTMSNGTKLMRDGNYTDKDGRKMRMQEGEHMDMSGNMTSRKADTDKNMYLIPDKHTK